MCNSSSQEAVGLNGAYGNLEIRAVSLGADRPNPEVRNFPPPHTHTHHHSPVSCSPGWLPGGRGTRTRTRVQPWGCVPMGWGCCWGAWGCSLAPIARPASLQLGRGVVGESCWRAATPLKGTSGAPGLSPKKQGGGLCLPTAHPTPFLTCRAQFLLDRSV